MKRNQETPDNSKLHVPVEIEEDWLKENGPNLKAQEEQLIAVNSAREAERCWIVGEIQAAAARNADFLEVKYKVNGIVCKYIVDIDKWKHSNTFKRLEPVIEILNVWDFGGFVKDEDSVTLLYKE